MPLRRQFLLAPLIAGALLAASLAAPRLCGQAPGGSAPGEDGIVVSELHYHPRGDVREEEFVELWNLGVHTVDIGGWRLSDAIEFEFPAGTVLRPGETIAVARSAEALRARDPLARIVGNFTGRLSNSTEVIRLATATGRTVLAFHYADGDGTEGGLWPDSPDGGGPSLELIAAHVEWEDPWRWKPSARFGGTPGRPRDEIAAKERPGLVINEVALAPDAFVELRGEASVNLDGFRVALRYLPLAPKTPSIALTGSIANERLLKITGLEPLLADLESSKDRPELLYLFDGQDHLVDAIELPTLAPGTSVGRYPDGASNRRIFLRASPGGQNSVPDSPELVINEIHFHGTSDDGSDEFIEIYNPTRRDIGLAGWSIEGGVKFEFPADASIARDGYLVVAKSPEALRARFTALRAPVHGPLKGGLSNRGERIELVAPSLATVDAVRYGDRAPWPGDADGAGPSLELRNHEIDNRYGAAWTRGALGGSPGEKNRNFHALVPAEIVSVRHEPAVARPGDRVVIHANVISTRPVSDVRVVYRFVGSTARPTATRLSDGGKLGGELRDGHFAGEIRIPSRAPSGSIIAYSVHADARGGRAVEGGENELFLPVLADNDRLSGFPTYHVLFDEATAKRFTEQSRSASDWLRCTFVASIAGEGVRSDTFIAHDAAIRQRGNNSRRPPDGRMSYRVRMPPGLLFDGREKLVLNAYASFRQKAGGDFLRRAGVLSPRVRGVRLIVADRNDARYLDIEPIDRFSLRARYGSAEGDVYRGVRGREVASDLAFRENATEAQYLAAYIKQNRRSDGDVEALKQLLRALATKDDASYLEKVEEVIDLEAWVTYFAANIILGNTENGLARGVADDYFLVRRPTDQRFVLFAWDQDSTYDEHDRALFKPALPTVRRLLGHPRIAPLYHLRIRELLAGPLGGVGWVREGLGLARFLPEDVEALDRFVWKRHAFLRGQTLLTPWVGLDSPPESSRPGGAGTLVFADPKNSTLEIRGAVHPGDVYGVNADGRAATYNPVEGTWKSSLAWGSVSLPLWIETLSRDGGIGTVHALRVEAAPAMTRLSGAIRGERSISAADGPVVLEGVVSVAPGSELRFGEGCDVVALPGASIHVAGRLTIAGTSARPVTFRPADPQKLWSGLRFTGRGGSGEPQSLRFARFEGGAAPAPGAPVEGAPQGAAPPLGFLDLDRGAELALEDCLLRSIRGVAISLRAGSLSLRNCVLAESETGVHATEGRLSIDSSVFRDLWFAGVLVEDGVASARLSATRVDRAERVGVSVHGAPIEIDELRITGCGVGLEVQGGARATGRALRVEACGVGVLQDRPLWLAPSGKERASTLRLDESSIGASHEKVRAAPGAKLEIKSGGGSS